MSEYKMVSAISDIDNKIHILSKEERQTIIREGIILHDESKTYNPDNHYAIFKRFGVSEKNFRYYNKHTYDIFTGETNSENTLFINNSIIGKELSNVEWSELFPYMNLNKKILNPFNIFNNKTISKEIINLLNVWIEVYTKLSDNIYNNITFHIDKIIVANSLCHIHTLDLYDIFMSGSSVSSIQYYLGYSEELRNYLYALKSIYAASFYKIDWTKYNLDTSNPFSSLDCLISMGIIPINVGNIWYLLNAYSKEIMYKLSI